MKSDILNYGNPLPPPPPLTGNNVGQINPNGNLLRVLKDMEGENVIFKAVRDDIGEDKPVSYIKLAKINDGLAIIDAFVDEQFAGRGIASELFFFIMDGLKTRYISVPIRPHIALF